MNELKVFSNKEFGDVRTVLIDSQVYFVASDVAKSLGYAKPQNAIHTHCKHSLKQGIGIQTGIKSDGTPSIQDMEVLVIPESDLYRLIMRSQLPSAERFSDWVCDEVLPSIRKNGEYSLSQRQDSYMISDPAERARRWAEEYEEKLALETKVNELSPKAYVYDKIIDSTLLINFRDAAKEIGISQSQFTGWLKENGYVYANSAGELRPMEPYMESGLFEMKPYQNPHSGYCGSRTYITSRGLAAFKIMLDTSGYNRGTMRKHGGKKRKS